MSKPAGLTPLVGTAAGPRAGTQTAGPAGYRSRVCTLATAATLGAVVASLVLSIAALVVALS